MELIKDKYDDKNNKIRPGSVFVGTRTDNLKYIDKDGAETELVPVSRYYAKEEILRGQPVSIAQLSDLTSENAKDKYAYVKVTNPDIDESCIGLALNYAEAGQIVQIQRYGTFSFLTTDSEKYKTQNKAGKLKEVFIDAKAGFLFDEVRGQKLYLKKKTVDETNAFDNDHESKALNNVETEATSTSITYDYMDSVYTAKNTIQIGQLTDAPTLYDSNGNPTDDSDQVVTIELDVTGDTRGPIDHSQFIVTLGEDITFEKGEDNTALTEPYNDEGIFNEVKVLALADRDPEKALFTIVPKTATPFNINKKAPRAFIGVRKLGGGSVIIPFSKGKTFESICDEQTNDNDIGYLKLLKSKYNSDQNPPVITDSLDLTKATVTDYTSKLKDAIIKALYTLDKEAFNTVAKDGETVRITSSDKDVDKETLVAEYQIQAAVAKGYFDIYESSELVKYFNVKTLKHGTEAPIGTAILADIRDVNRTNVIGVVVDNFDGVHKKGSTIKVMRMGRFLTTGNMKVGAEYFLGLNGRITTKSQYWYDTMVKIGTTETAHNLIVNVQEMQHDFSGSLEMGFVKSCAGLIPEKGFVLMDGETPLEKVAYDDFYEYLMGIYDPSELYAYEKDAEGNITDKIDEDHFIVPKVVMDDGKTVCQIKYIPNGIYHNLPRAPFLRFYGTIDENNSVEERDVTRLVHYGTLEQSRIAPTLENIEIRLFVREPENKLFPVDLNGKTEYADKYIWREIPQGFHVYNNDTVYGFDWVVKQNDYADTDGVYKLEMETNQGLGICKINAQGQPIPLKGAEYKLIVTAKNLWTREYSLLDTSDVADSMELNTDSIAPSVNAIRDYYEKKVATKELNVADGEIYSNVNGTSIKNLTINKTTFVDESGKSLEDRDNDFAEHVNRTANYSYTNEDGNTINEGVHGLVNLGAEGNLDAKSIAGLQLSDGNNNLTVDADPNKNWIPFVKENDASSYTTINTATSTVGHLKDGSIMYTNNVEYAKTSSTGSIDAVVDALKLENVTASQTQAIIQYTKAIQFGDNEFKAIFKGDTNKITLTLTAGTTKSIDISGITSLAVSNLTIKRDDFTFEFDDEILSALNSMRSSIAFKTVISEKINPNIKNALGTILTPNTKIDANGNAVDELDTGSIPTDLSLNSVEKLGSALQALYEMPLSVFEYNYNGMEYKQQLGILIERVNQIRESLKDASNIPTFTHKISTLVPSTNKNIYEYKNGIEDSAAGENNKFASSRQSLNEYSYTETEATSIANYLNLVTNKKELAQELRSTVSILLAAAQETQERLLNVEASVFGFDADTIPGNETNKKAISDKIDESLRQALNNSPLLLGLNRLMRAICLELYDTTDLEAIDSETQNVLEDSDKLESKLTVKSRVDTVDTILTDLMYRYNGLVHLYNSSLTEGETHNTWEPLVVNGEEVVSVATTEAETDESNSIDITAEDNHTRKGQVDKSGTWKTLPDTTDVKDDTKNTVDFANIYSGSGKHSPNKEDCGIVKVPETETETKTDDKSSKSDKAITITKVRYDEKTGLPIYKEHGVAFLDSKVERMNLKLSELTKTIYGVDDVTAKFPNRTEVLRRNIDNLINDLYPNKSFDSEVVTKNGLYKPFTGTSKSKDIEGVKFTTDGDENNLSGLGRSIIKPIVYTLYTFESKNDYIKGLTSNDLSKIVASHNNTASIVNGNISWSANNLSTTSTEFNKNFDDSTLNQIDWLKDALGIKNTLTSSLYQLDNLFSSYLQTSSFTDSSSGALVKATKDSNKDLYKQELAYRFIENAGKENASWSTTNSVEPIVNATTREALYSRKAKSLEERLTTVEASLDDFANLTKKISSISSDEGSKSFTDYHKDSACQTRFENNTTASNIQAMVESMVYGNNEPFVFDKAFFDAGMEWGTTSVNGESIWEHNKAIIADIDKMFTVDSKALIPESSNCNYKLNCTKVTSPFSPKVVNVDNNNQATIAVEYTTETPKSLAKNTIYLKNEVVKNPNIGWSYSNSAEADLSKVQGVNVTSDLVSKNLLLQMKAIAKEVAQSTFDMAHPIGSIYMESPENITNYTSPTTFTKSSNNYGINTGTWELQGVDENNKSISPMLITSKASKDDGAFNLSIVSDHMSYFTYKDDSGNNATVSCSKGDLKGTAVEKTVYTRKSDTSSTTGTPIYTYTSQTLYCRAKYTKESTISDLYGLVEDPLYFKGITSKVGLNQQIKELYGKVSSTSKLTGYEYSLDEKITWVDWSKIEAGNTYYINTSEEALTSEWMQQDVSIPDGNTDTNVRLIPGASSDLSYVISGDSNQNVTISDVIYKGDSITLDRSYIRIPYQVTNIGSMSYLIWKRTE